MVFENIISVRDYVREHFTDYMLVSREYWWQTSWLREGRLHRRVQIQTGRTRMMTASGRRARVLWHLLVS